VNSDAPREIADGAARRLGIEDEDRNPEGRATSSDPLGFNVIYGVAKLAWSIYTRHRNRESSALDRQTLKRQLGAEILKSHNLTPSRKDLIIEAVVDECLDHASGNEMDIDHSSDTNH